MGVLRPAGLNLILVKKQRIQAERSAPIGRSVTSPDMRLCTAFSRRAQAYNDEHFATARNSISRGLTPEQPPRLNRVRKTDPRQDLQQDLYFTGKVHQHLCIMKSAKLCTHTRVSERCHPHEPEQQEVHHDGDHGHVYSSGPAIQNWRGWHLAGQFEARNSAMGDRQEQ